MELVSPPTYQFLAFVGRLMYMESVFSMNLIALSYVSAALRCEISVIVFIFFSQFLRNLVGFFLIKYPCQVRESIDFNYFPNF